MGSSRCHQPHIDNDRQKDKVKTICVTTHCTWIKIRLYTSIPEKNKNILTMKNVKRISVIMKGLMYLLQLRWIIPFTSLHVLPLHSKISLSKTLRIIFHSMICVGCKIPDLNIKIKNSDKTPSTKIWKPSQKRTTLKICHSVILWPQ